MTNENDHTDYTVVVQDGYAVFGVGRSVADAIADAKQWVDDPDVLEAEIAGGESGRDGDMIMMDCSKKYYEAVRAGADYDGYLEDENGCVITPEEYDKQQ